MTIDTNNHPKSDEDLENLRRSASEEEYYCSDEEEIKVPCSRSEANFRTNYALDSGRNNGVWDTVFATVRRRKPSNRAAGFEYEKGESVESLLKKFRELNKESDKPIKVESIRGGIVLPEKQKKRTFSGKFDCLRKKIKGDRNSARLVEKDKSVQHDYKYKPSFLSKSLLFLNKAFD